MNKAFIAEARSDRSSRKPAMRFRHVGILAFVDRALKIFGERVAEARRMRQAYEELAAMSDRELKDIGITRNDIPAVVARTYHRARPAVSNVITLDRPCGLQSPGAHSQPREPSNAQLDLRFSAWGPARTRRGREPSRILSTAARPLVMAIAKRAAPSKE